MGGLRQALLSPHFTDGTSRPVFSQCPGHGGSGTRRRPSSRGPLTHEPQIDAHFLCAPNPRAPERAGAQSEQPTEAVGRGRDRPHTDFHLKDFKALQALIRPPHPSLGAQQEETSPEGGSQVANVLPTGRTLQHSIRNRRSPRAAAARGLHLPPPPPQASRGPSGPQPSRRQNVPSALLAPAHGDHRCFRQVERDHRHDGVASVHMHPRSGGCTPRRPRAKPASANLAVDVS